MLKCKLCDSEEIYSIDNEPLAHGEDVNGYSQYDTELYTFFRCKNCCRISKQMLCVVEEEELKKLRGDAMSEKEKSLQRKQKLHEESVQNLIDKTIGKEQLIRDEEMFVTPDFHVTFLYFETKPVSSTLEMKRYYYIVALGVTCEEVILYSSNVIDDNELTKSYPYNLRGTLDMFKNRSLNMQKVCESI